MIDVRWAEAAAIELTNNNHTVLIDPYRSRPGRFKVHVRPLIPDVHAIE